MSIVNDFIDRLASGIGRLRTNDEEEKKRLMDERRVFNADEFVKKPDLTLDMQEPQTQSASAIQQNPSKPPQVITDLASLKTQNRINPIKKFGEYLANIPEPAPYQWKSKSMQDSISKYGNMADPIHSLEKFSSDIVRSYGRTIVNLSDEAGWRNLAQGAKDLFTTKPTFETLRNPVVETALNLLPLTAGKNTTFRSFVPDLVGPSEATTALNMAAVATKTKPGQVASAFDYVPAQSLSSEARQVETQFGNYLKNNYENAVTTYRNKFGNVINTDNARELSDAYNKSRETLSAAVHEPASAFSKKMYEDMLSETVPAGKNNEVLFTAGGTGAGKSTAIITSPEFKTTADQAHIVYDTNLNTFTSSKDKIEKALAANKDVKIVYVLRDPIDAMLNGTIPRANRMGRTVPLDAHLDTHIGSLETIQKLAEEYKNNSKVQIGVIDNSFGKGNARPIPLDELKNISYNRDELKTNISSLLDSLYENKKIDPKIYEGITGKTNELPLVASGTGQQLEQANRQTGVIPEDLPFTESPQAGNNPPGIPNNKNQDIIYDQSGTGKIHKVTDPNKFEYDLKSLSTAEDVKNIILDSVRNGQKDGILQTQRRKTMSWTQTRNLADNLGMSVEDVMKRKPGQTFNAEEADAANRLMLQVNEELFSIGQKINELQKSGQVVPEELKIAQMQKASEAMGISSAVIGDRSETARALNASKMFKEAMETTTEAARNKVIEKAAKMFGGDKKTAEEVFVKLSQFDPEDTLGQLKFLRQIKPSTTMEKIVEYWYNSVLSNTATHIVNGISNLASTVLVVPEKAVAGSIDYAFSKMTNKEQTRFIAEASAEVSGIKAGFTNGYRRMTQVLKHGITEADVSKVEFGKEQAIKGVVGDVVNTPSRALVAGDELFKGINYEMDIWAQAANTAKAEKLSGTEYTQRVADLVANPTAQMIELANDNAKYRLFQAESRSAQAVAKFRDNMAVIKLGKFGEFKPLQFIIPFIQTSVNVVKFGLERSPLGFVKAGYSALNGANKAQVADELARAFIGTSILAPLAMYATEDKITGAAPSARDERDAWYADGKLPWSIKIGDTWYAYNRIEPLNTVLSQIAMWHDAFKNNDEVVSLETLSEFGRQMSRNVADQTFMTGIGNLYDAIEDPERYGEKFITDILGGFVPSFAAAGARATDNTVRKPEGVVEALSARLPLLSQTTTPFPSDYEPGGNAIRHTNEGVMRNIASNFLGFRSSRETGANNLEQLQTLKSLNKEAKTKSEAQKTLAEKVVDELDAAKPEQRAQIVADYKNQGVIDDATEKKIQSIIQERKLGLTAQENDLKNASVYARAMYMYQELENLTPDERRAWVKNAKDKKIISDAVEKEFQKIVIQKRNEKTTDLPLR